MNRKEVKNKANELYKKSEYSYWILGILCGLLMAGFFAIGIVNNLLLIIIVPFAIVPVFFAGHVAFIAIQQGEKITLSKALQYFTLYFKNPFNSSFSFMKAFFKTLLIFLVSFLVCCVIAYFGVNAVLPERLKAFIEQLQTLIESKTFTPEQLLDLLNQFKDVVVPLTYTATVPPVLLTFVGYLFFISEHSLNVYFRLACPIQDSQILSVVAKVVGTKNKKEFPKDYFYLNYPLYILAGIGSACGVVLSIFTNQDSTFASIIGCSFALAAIALYLPFYFPRMQCLYESYAPMYQSSLLLAAADISKNINSSKKEGLKQDNDKKSEIVDIDINKDDDTSE